MKALFILDQIAALIAFALIMRMIMFRKIIKVLPDGTVSEELEAGKYNIIVLGVVSGETIRRTNMQIETPSDKTLDIKVPHFAVTGVADFKKFTNIAKFSITTPEELTVHVSNIRREDIKKSKLFIKRLLFNQNAAAVEIGVIKSISFVRLFLLALLFTSLFFLLFLQ